jgi:hypothetical protein
MALTRPKLSNINTDVAGFIDPITVLHQGATTPNTDVGFLFNRANGLVSNVAVYWSEASQSFVTAFTANTGTTNSNIAIFSEIYYKDWNAYIDDKKVPFYKIS